MQKKYRAVSLLILLCLLTGCSFTAKNKNVVVTDNTEKYEDGIFFTSYHRIAVGPEGYYILNMPGTEGYLTYLDKESGKETYLCSKPDCSHVDDSVFHYGLQSCDAYVGCVISGSIIYYNDFIYLLEYDRETYDVTLAQISTDGSVHEEIMKIGQAPDFGSYYKYVFTDSNTIYITYDDPVTAGEERTASLIQIDLKRKKMTPVYTYSGFDVSFSCLKVMENDLLFMQVTRENDTYIQHLMKYNLETKKTDIVIETGINSYTLVGKRQLAYFVPKDGIYLYDMESMQSQRIRLSDNETMFATLACDGTYLYVDNIENRYFFDEASERKILICDLRGELINTIPAGPVYTELSDGNYIFTKIFVQGKDGGEFWSYIKNSEITNPDVEWTVLRHL